MICGTKRTKNANGPCNEEDLALPAIINGDKVEIKHGVSAIIVRQGRCEVFVSFAGAADLIDGDQFGFLINLEHYVPVHFLPFHLHE